MQMTCNIDAKGKLFRLVTGIISCSFGIILFILISTNVITSSVYLLPALGSIIGGLFAVWEARAGWCIVRSLGIKTPI
ncbi:MAG: hypothetical protein NLN64_03730 [Candidatus Thalassarchaeaceae archaeon]|nr:hypothetical protein [Candidatus Thalassarchaeaceae archaeon]